VDFAAQTLTVPDAQMLRTAAGVFIHHEPYIALVLDEMPRRDFVWRYVVRLVTANSVVS